MTSDTEELLNKAEGHLDKGEYKAADGMVDRFFGSLAGMKEVPPQLLIRAHLCAARALIYRIELEDAKKHCDEAMRLADRGKDVLNKANALRWIGHIQYRKGELQKALSTFQEGILLAKKTENRELEGIYHIEMGNCFISLGDRPRGMEEHRIAIRILEKLKGSSELARALNNLADGYMYYGEWQKAADMFSKVKAVAGDHIGRRGWGGFNRAECLMELGRFKEAKEELDVAIPLLERSGDNHGKTAAYEILGLVRARMGDLDQAKADLEYAVDLASRNEMPLDKARALTSLGRMYMWRGDNDKAKIYYDQARVLFQAHSATGDLRKLDTYVKEMNEIKMKR